MLVWSPTFPQRRKPLGYLRLLWTRACFHEHFRLSWRGLERVPGDFERLTDLRNIHAGRRAFVLGTGPSLRNEDLRRLKGEIVFGCNGLYKAYAELGWMPMYHTVIDRTQLEDRQKDLNELRNTTLFVPLFSAYCISRRSNVIFLPLRWPDKKRFGYPKFSDDAAAAVWDGMTVTLSNLQLAFHMGVREVILLGIDFSYSLSSKVQTGTDTLNGIGDSPDHFITDYYTGQKRFVQFYPNLQRQAYRLAREVFEQNGGKLVNASRETKLDVIDRVNFDSLF